MNARPDLCSRVNVRAYPTWIVRGERREGVQSLEELAEMAGFQETATAAPGTAPR